MSLNVLNASGKFCIWGFCTFVCQLPKVSARDSLVCLSDMELAVGSHSLSSFELQAQGQMGGEGVEMEETHSYHLIPSILKNQLLVCSQTVVIVGLSCKLYNECPAQKRPRCFHRFFMSGI